MEGQADKVNYRQDRLVDNCAIILRNQKTSEILIKNIFKCLSCMTDGLTDKVNYTLDTH